MNHRNLAKHLLYPSALLSMLLLLAACIAPVSAPQAPAASPTDVTTTEVTTTDSADSAAYPITITDEFGDVSIPARPERIITLGEEINETLLSLGVKPVGFGSGRVEALAGLETDAIMTIQFGEGVQDGFPIEPILESLQIPVLRTVIEPHRPATGPITERYYMENFATLLMAEFGN